MEYLLYIALGALSGFAAGLLGIGGGLVVVAPLAAVLEAKGVPREMALHMAVASALATIVATAVSSTVAHHRRGAVRWPLVLGLAPAMVAGSLLGAQVVAALPARGLALVVGGVAAAAGARMLLGLTPAPGARVPGPGLLAGAGVVIGAVSAMVGIGGGVMTVPLLVRRRLAMGQAVGTSAALGLPIALTGSIALALAGPDADQRLPPGATGFLYWPAVLTLAAVTVLTAPLGARLAHALPARTLARVFGVFLLAVAAYLWLR
jgi:uncharacterized membrane protein YfcA